LYKPRARSFSKGRDNYKNAKIGLGHLIIFFPRTTKTEKLRSTQKLPDIVEIHVCTNHGPQG
jgi:hypothetical protein